MTKKIIVSGWEKLSEREKKLVEGCISSILSARQASVTLLKLLSQNHATPEFIARLEEFSNQQDDFEIVASATESEIENFARRDNIVTSATELEDVNDLCETICRLVEIAGISQTQCMRVCRDQLSVSE